MFGVIAMNLAFFIRHPIWWMAIFLTGFVVLPLPVVADEEHPTCSALHFDANGDGFGWENEATCRVTDTTVSAPVHINRELNTTVDLVRPYWDGNHDIANREIQCDHFYYDTDQGQYLAREAYYDSNWEPTLPTETFVHWPIPSVEPYLGFMSSPLAEGDPSWTVIDGLYYGPSLLAHPYVELVLTDDGAGAIRLWFDANSEAPLELAFSDARLEQDGYYECYDRSGADLSPAGLPGQATQSPAELVDLTLSVIGHTEQQNPDLIFNLVTGEPVSLQKAYWDYNRDLAPAVNQLQHLDL